MDATLIKNALLEGGLTETQLPAEIAATAKMEESFRAAFKAIGPTMATIAGLCRDLYQAAYQNYLESGAIYGESHDGFMKWLDDVGQIAAAQRKVEEITIKHETIRELSRHLSENGAKNGAKNGAQSATR